MTERTDGDPALIDETLDEHRGCMMLVTELENCLDRRPEDPRQWTANLKQAFNRLGAALRRHFEGEEAGPMFRNLPTRHPRLAGALARLEAEHKEMLEDMTAIESRLEPVEEPEMHELRELNARVQLFVARIRRHEASENELVLQAYWDEVGVGD